MTENRQVLRTANVAPALAPDQARGFHGEPIPQNPVRSAEPQPSPDSYGVGLIRAQVYLRDKPPDTSALDKQ